MNVIKLIKLKNKEMKTKEQKKTKAQKKQRNKYVIIHDSNDLLEVLGYASRKQASINHKNTIK